MKMRKQIIGSILAVLSTAVLCACICLTPAVNTAPVQTVEVETVETAVAPAEETVETFKAEEAIAETEQLASERELDEEELAIRFTNMLNLNFCYNDNFKNAQMTAVCSAISLSDYATDIPGLGIGVGQHLVEEFAESFYGIKLDTQSIECEDIVDGYVMTPQYSVGTQSHTIVSVTETDGGFEVVSTVELYYGGDDADTVLATSVFKKAPSSQFGFNLISCELS